MKKDMKTCKLQNVQVQKNRKYADDYFSYDNGK